MNGKLTPDNTFNFIDRQIVGILAVPIKAELHLSDSQLGLMGGFAFALFYTLLGIPIARLADRVSRTAIMTAALALWSLMTASVRVHAELCAAIPGARRRGGRRSGRRDPGVFLDLRLLSPEERARALSVYSFGIPIGAALGIVLGGYITSLMSWRMAFFIVGLAGLLLTPLLKFTVREPERGALDPQRRPRRAGAGPTLLRCDCGARAQSELLGIVAGCRLRLNDGIRIVFLGTVLPGAQFSSELCCTRRWASAPGARRRT